MCILQMPPVRQAPRIYVQWPNTIKVFKTEAGTGHRYNLKVLHVVKKMVCEHKK